MSEIANPLEGRIATKLSCMNTNANPCWASVPSSLSGRIGANLYVRIFSNHNNQSTNTTCHISCVTLTLWVPVLKTTGQLSHHYDGSMQKRHNSIANALELHLFCIEPWICQQMSQYCKDIIRQSGGHNTEAFHSVFGYQWCQTQLGWSDNSI